jgi:hypothetical protein
METCPLCQTEGTLRGEEARERHLERAEAAADQQACHWQTRSKRLLKATFLLCLLCVFVIVAVWWFFSFGVAMLD